MVVFMNSRKDLVFFKKTRQKMLRTRNCSYILSGFYFSSMLDFYQSVTYFS